MPTLHNPAEFRLFCSRLGRVLDADERVEITAQEAADLADGAVFIVESEPEPEPSAAPVRKRATRGSKRIEVTASPQVETRG